MNVHWMKVNFHLHLMIKKERGLVNKKWILHTGEYTCY